MILKRRHRYRGVVTNLAPSIDMKTPFEDSFSTLI